MCMANFIKNRNIKHNREKNISCLEGFGKTVWTFISFIFEGKWSKLNLKDGIKNFCHFLMEKVSNNIPVHNNNKKFMKTLDPKPVEFSNVSNVSHFYPFQFLPDCLKRNWTNLNFTAKIPIRPRTNQDIHMCKCYLQTSMISSKSKTIILIFQIKRSKTYTKL